MAHAVSLEELRKTSLVHSNAKKIMHKSIFGGNSFLVLASPLLFTETTFPHVSKEVVLCALYAEESNALLLSLFDDATIQTLPHDFHMSSVVLLY